MCDANEINEEKYACFATAGINVKEVYFCFMYKQASISVVIGIIYQSIHSRDRERIVLLTTQEALHDVDTRHA